MRNDVWQRLLGFESRDAVCKWYEKLHGRELNARRAIEITSAAKQAREFFRNSANANDSVKPLLTFYGVAGLCRAVVLLLRRSGGEETLAGSHGVETLAWSAVLSGDIGSGLRALDLLKIRTTQGLFSEFLRETNNRICMHVASSAVDWRLTYPSPAVGSELSLGDLLERLPDLAMEYARLGRAVGYATVNSLTISESSGFEAKIRADQFAGFKEAYAAEFSVKSSDGWCDITCDAPTFERCIPQFMHTYVAKTFGSIPSLHIVKPFADNARYSQLAVTYLVSYCLGMLSRYYPTHWTMLLSGGKGDELWPAINLAQKYVESGFPELVIEFVEDSLRQGLR